jgi:hypothetical protein
MISRKVALLRFNFAEMKTNVVHTTAPSIAEHNASANTTTTKAITSPPFSDNPDL